MHIWQWQKTYFAPLHPVSQHRVDEYSSALVSDSGRSRNVGNMEVRTCGVFEPLCLFPPLGQSLKNTCMAVSLDSQFCYVKWKEIEAPAHLLQTPSLLSELSVKQTFVEYQVCLTESSDNNVAVCKGDKCVNAFFFFFIYTFFLYPVPSWLCVWQLWKWTVFILSDQHYSQIMFLI